MRWVAASSENHRLSVALDEVSRAVQDGLREDEPHLLVVFASQHHLFDLGRVTDRLRENFGTRTLLGSSADSVIGPGVELEARPGVSLLAAHLPGVQIQLAHVENRSLPALDGSPQPWRDLIGTDADLRPDFLVLADPFSCDTGRLLQGLDYAHPGATVVGGLASGSRGPGGNALFTTDGIHRTGALVLSLAGNLRIDPLVAQGCRPVGSPARVTACEGNLLKTLDDRSPAEFLQDLFDGADEAERELLRSSLQLGLLTSEGREEFGPGDFLIRNILGMHKESGMVAVGAELRPQQTVQFHVRDGKAASSDLRARLRRVAERARGDHVAGALQFTCLGRGRSLFRAPDHDARALQEELGPLPATGFFCNGEIGPVGGSTWLHGFTSSFALFRPRSG